MRDVCGWGYVCECECVGGVVSVCERVFESMCERE